MPQHLLYLRGMHLLPYAFASTKYVAQSEDQDVSTNHGRGVALRSAEGARFSSPPRTRREAADLSRASSRLIAPLSKRPSIGELIPSSLSLPCLARCFASCLIPTYVVALPCHPSAAVGTRQEAHHCPKMHQASNHIYHIHMTTFSLISMSCQNTGLPNALSLLAAMLTTTVPGPMTASHEHPTPLQWPHELPQSSIWTRSKRKPL